LTQEYPPNSSRLNREYNQALPERTRTRSQPARRAAATPTAPRGQQRAGARARSASRPAGRSTGVPGPARSVTSIRTVPSPEMTATVTVSPGSPDRLCRTLLLKISLTSKTATSPHGCPGPSTAETNARAARARSARPASVTLSRTAALAITAPALPRPPRPGTPAGQRADAGKCTLSSAPNVKPAQQAFADPCPWPVRGRGPRPWPSVQSRRSPAPLPGPDSRPLCVRGHRNMTPYSDPR
jgi:hypothetical protein